MTFKTMQEQEREAYVTGHTGMAKLLADVIESHEAKILLEDREFEVQTEIDDLKAQLQETEDELRLERARNQELRDELDAL